MKKKRTKSLSHLKKWYYDAYEKYGSSIRYQIESLELPEYLTIKPHPFILGEVILYDKENAKDYIVVGHIDEDYNTYCELYLKNN